MLAAGDGVMTRPEKRDDRRVTDVCAAFEVAS
jgi:hypothetical protein